MLEKVFRRRAYYIASAAFFLLTLIYFVSLFNHPYIGIWLEDSKGRWTVHDSDPHGEAYDLGIRIGDVILKVDGREPADYPLVQKRKLVEGANTLEFLQPGSGTPKDVAIPKPKFLVTFLREAPMTLMGVLFWLLGLITWIKRPFLVQARAMFWLNCLLGLVIALAAASSRAVFLAWELENIVFSFVPSMLAGFMAVFPVENKTAVNHYGTRILGGAAVVFSLATILQSLSLIDAADLLRQFIFLSVLLGLGLALWNLIMSIRLPNKDDLQKNQVILVFLGMAVGLLPFAAFTALPGTIGLPPLLAGEVTGLSLAVIPATWSYILVSKHLPNGRSLLASLLTFFVTAIVLCLAAFFVLFATGIVGSLSLEVSLALFSLTLLLLLVMLVVRAGVGCLVNTLLLGFKQMVNKTRILELNENLASINAETILEEVTKALNLEGALVIAEDGNGWKTYWGCGRYQKNLQEQAVMEEFFHSSIKGGESASLLPSNFPATVYIPFSAQDFVCGVFLGERTSRVKIRPEELPLLTLIAFQLGQQLKTSLLIGELSTEVAALAKTTKDSQLRSQGLKVITHSLFNSLEKERKALAREIHDGPLQLGMDLNRRLKQLIEEPVTEISQEKLFHLQELVEDFNCELRALCSDLRPPSLSDLGLLPAIELMCQDVMLRELFLITMETEGIGRDERYSEEVELATFRFLQEGIINAVKHSGSTTVQLGIVARQQELELIVFDSGKGFDTARIADWSLVGTHFGLVGMKERIESLGGTLEIKSTPGKGTTLKAVIPKN